MNKKNMSIIAAGVTALLLSGCSGKSMFSVGYEDSVCANAKSGGVCGSPSAVYKYKNKVKQIQKNYFNSGYPDELYFAVTRDGRILVKDTRDGKWQQYKGSKYEKEINRLLDLKFNTKLGPGASNDGSPSYSPSSSDDLSVVYKKKAAAPTTQTNVGRMIRDNGEYARTWVAPYIDSKGDLVSAHEVYSVVREPEWVIGEKTPKRVVDASTPTPFSEAAYKSKHRKKRYGSYSTKPPKQSKSQSKAKDVLKDFVENDNN